MLRQRLSTSDISSCCCPRQCAQFFEYLMFRCSLSAGNNEGGMHGSVSFWEQGPALRSLFILCVYAKVCLQGFFFNRRWSGKETALSNGRRLAAALERGRRLPPWWVNFPCSDTFSPATRKFIPKPSDDVSIHAGSGRLQCRRHTEGHHAIQVCCSFQGRPFQPRYTHTQHPCPEIV